MGGHVGTHSSGSRHAAFGLGLGVMAGAFLGLLPRRSGSAVLAERPDGASGAPTEQGTPEQPVYEYLSRVAWSDHTRGVNSDLEDAEGLDAIARGGWELIDVIVPFAQTRHLDVSYPGNTRKLIAYYRRPKVREER
jgi:hypothetical protein